MLKWRQMLSQDRLQVLICSVNVARHFPYQWALLKTYSEDDPLINSRVLWRDPLELTQREAEKELSNPKEFCERYGLESVAVLGLSCYVWNIDIQLRIAELVKS